MRRFLKLALLSAWFIPLVANALSVRTIAFDLPADSVMLSLRSDASEKDVNLEVCVNQISESTTLPPGSYVAAAADFKEPAKFVLPESGSGSYLLLVLQKRDGSYQILPVADDLSRFRKGDRFVVNATAVNLSVRIHTQKYLLKPGRTAFYHMPPPPLPENRIEVEMFYQAAGGWLPFNSTYWPVGANSRSIVLIHPDANTGKPRVRSLADRPHAEPLKAP